MRLQTAKPGRDQLDVGMWLSNPFPRQQVRISDALYHHPMGVHSSLQLSTHQAQRGSICIFPAKTGRNGRLGDILQSMRACADSFETFADLPLDRSNTESGAFFTAIHGESHSECCCGSGFNASADRPAALASARGMQPLVSCSGQVLT